MELRHLRYFVAVAQEQNVTRAAARLHVSQPPLSRQIKDLEDELGVALFDRGPQSVRLTPAGKVFLTEAQAVLRRAEEAVQAARVAGGTERGELDVAFAPSLTVQILPETLRVFQKSSPRVRVHLHDLSTEDMVAGLRERALDVALMIHPGQKQLRGVVFEELYRYPLQVAVHPGHRLARSRRVRVQDLLKERLIGYSQVDYPEYREKMAAVFRPWGTLPGFAEEHDSSTSLIAAVEAGRGVALVPSSLGCLVGPRLRMKNLLPNPEALVVGMARREGTVSKLVEAFLGAAQVCRAAAK